MSPPAAQRSKQWYDLLGHQDRSMVPCASTSLHLPSDLAKSKSAPFEDQLHTFDSSSGFCMVLWLACSTCSEEVHRAKAGLEVRPGVVAILYA